MAFIANSQIIHNGKGYKAGDNVVGLTEEQANRLLELGVIEGEGTFISDNPNISDLITPEEFAKLSAQEQREQLDVSEIEPAGNAEGRLQQYADWYELQVKKDEI